MVSYSLDRYPRLEVIYDENSGKKISSEIVEIDDFVGIKSLKAKGKRLTTFEVAQFNWLTPLKPDPEPEPEEEDIAIDAEPDENLGYAEGTQTQLF